MKIIDINGKSRRVRSVCKIKHDAIDTFTGEPVPETFIEVVIIGHNREWVEWWPLAEFKRFNPNRRPRWK